MQQNTYRCTVTGTTSPDALRSGRTLTVYVSATDRDHALDVAFDDMGLVAVWSVRKVSSKPLAR